MKQQQQQQLVSLFLLLVSTAGLSYGRYLAPRATLIPGQACSFQPYNKLLTCGCGGKVGERHELTLQLQLFIRDQGQEVSFFLIFVQWRIQSSSQQTSELVTIIGRNRPGTGS